MPRGETTLHHQSVVLQIICALNLRVNQWCQLRITWIPGIFIEPQSRIVKDRLIFVYIDDVERTTNVHQNRHPASRLGRRASTTDDVDLSTALSTPELEIRNDPSLPARSIDRLMPTIDSTLSLSFDLICGTQRGRIAFTLSSEAAKVLIRSLDGPPKTARQTSPEMQNGLLTRLQRTMHFATLQLPTVRAALRLRWSTDERGSQST